MTEENASLEGVLFRHGTLFDLDIGRWAAMRRLRANDLLYEVSTEEALQLGNKRLLPADALKDVKEIESKARAYLANRSTAFPIGGGRFVSSHVLTEVIHRLNELKTGFYAAVESLIENYPELRNRQIAVLDKTEYEIALEKHKSDPSEENWGRLSGWLTQKYNEHRSIYPTPEELQTKFRFVWRMFRIDPTSGIEGLTEEQAQAMREAQQQLRGELQEWVRQASAEMHQTLGAAALNASQLLARQGKLDPRNLRPLFEAFESFRAMDFTGQSSFQEAVQRARASFTLDAEGNVDFARSAEALNNEQAKAAFGELLSTMGSLAQGAVAEEAGIRAIRSSGEFSRVLDL